MGQVNGEKKSKILSIQFWLGMRWWLQRNEMHLFQPYLYETKKLSRFHFATSEALRMSSELNRVKCDFRSLKILFILHAKLLKTNSRPVCFCEILSQLLASFPLFSTFHFKKACWQKFSPPFLKAISFFRSWPLSYCLSLGYHDIVLSSLSLSLLFSPLVLNIYS